MRIESWQETGHLVFIDLPHPIAVSAAVYRTGVGHVGQTVAELYKRGVWRLTNTLIVLLPCPLSTGTALVVGQGIDNLRPQQRLFFRHPLTGHLHHIVVGQTSILDTVVVKGAKEDRQHVFLTDTHQMAITTDTLDHHIQMETVWQLVAIGLIDTLMQLMGSKSDFLYLLGILLLKSLKFFFCHTKTINSAAKLQNIVHYALRIMNYFCTFAAIMVKNPHPLIACIPVVVLIGLLAIAISLFGSDSLSGGSQIALLMGMAVCVSLSMTIYKTPWHTFEKQIKATLGEVSITLLILLCVGMLAGSWMVSGIVPSLIYYGVQIMSPQFFLVSSCIICALVSLLSGSSWTTIATIGVALLGIGHALGVSEAWTAGAIISGAYFGDKMSPLSDTTILASSATGTDLFVHIRYMMFTTMPTFLITITIFFITGLDGEASTEVEVSHYTEGLSRTFNISLWTLLVPLLTGVLIARRVPSLIVLFASSVMAGIVAIILQPHILCEIAGGGGDASVASLTRGLAITYFGATAVDTGNASLNELISTSGMAGMLNTIWLILCAMCFGAAMVASRMIESITKIVIRFIRNRVSLVSSTVGTGIFLNITTGDQFISIVLNADIYKEVYKQEGYESRLLSRTTEDAATVTSVLIPWNTCGMTQSTVLGVPTLTYLPYCFFNLLSPLMSIFIVAIGWKIKKINK